jgi:DNA mismatch repair protein MutH
MYKTKDFDYDEKDTNSILDYAKKLVNHTLSTITSAPLILRESSAKSLKGKFGQYLEEYYFNIKNNSDTQPDFKEVGLELKSTPLKKLKNGKLVSKERLVLNIINYKKIVNEIWEKSSFLNKNQLLLLVFYLYERDKSFLDCLIKQVTLLKLEGQDREIIRQDWEKIIRKIKAGKAHELSEGDTFYLGACRKGWKEPPRIQPNSPIKAPQRAFSFKARYMNHILSKSHEEDSVIKNVNKLKTIPFENIIYEKFKPFLGKNRDDIEESLGLELNKGAKNYSAVLVRGMLGVKTMKIDEFEKAGVSIKIIRLKHNGVPKEDMSFPCFKYLEIAKQNWFESDFSQQLEHKFFFVVFQMNKDESKTLLKKVFFWNIPFEDLGEVRRVWEETKKRVLEGNSQKLPLKTENEVAHVRPHARNKLDTLLTPQGEQVIKKSFWLNAKYLKKQIELN